MRTIEIPSADVIRKFTAPVVRGPVPIEKNGEALATEGSFRTVWMDITPALAATWLKNNFRNRPIKEDVVCAYARDMVNRVWRATHQGIAFNDCDELIDGQHRLLAIIKSGRTIRMMVTFGLATKIEGSQMTTMDCVDRGATRSVADQLKIQHGLKNGSAIAQVCSSLAHLCVGERMRRLSVGQTLDIYTEFKSSVDFVIEHRSTKAGLKSAGVLGAFAFVMAPLGGGASVPASRGSSVASPHQWINPLFIALETGGNLVATPAVAKLREFLTGENASLILASMNRGIAELTVWAILNREAAELAKEPADWIKAVEHFRALQRARVEKIANIFKLPVGTAAGAKPAAANAAPAETKPVVEPVAATNAATPGTPAQPTAPAKARPSVTDLLGRVENHFKISRFIITGRGDGDPEIQSARTVFVHLARSHGHTAGVVAASLKRTEEKIRDYTLPLAAMSNKQKKAVETILGKL